MFRRFGPDAYDVLALSCAAAGRLHHDYIGTEHLLIGLTDDDIEAARALFELLGMDRERLRLEAETRLGTGDAASAEHWALTPRTAKVIHFAQQEAWRSGVDSVGSEHLLLGILRAGGGGGAQILTTGGLTLNGAREVIARFVEERGDEVQPRPRIIEWLAYRRWLRRPAPSGPA